MAAGEQSCTAGGQHRALLQTLSAKVSGCESLMHHVGATNWRLRGKLDVPKERWISFPHCAGPDGTLVIAWAGYDHLQLAKAISTYYVDIQERLGGRDDPRLIPLLACLIELLPWLKQWHNEPDATFDGMRTACAFSTSPVRKCIASTR